ncbi:hypothetical protein BDY19DRAFT_893607 [Irpex rosettiformis]|uniref:Uncharacterized protein n=1 Tax=Irpex rosettiformis TaxID=378272 RepID=A0ACB8TYR8_9APHY|nr:hypothetical protein BDY19DRAFT_893607 [Irpex rosettiformis]
MAPAILLIGLPWQSLPDNLKELAEKVRIGLEGLETRMPDAGYDFHGCYAHPKDGYQPFTDAITSRKWDVIIIGFGVRGTPDFTVFFEWLVNEIKEKAPQTKIGFNHSPESTLDAAKRLAPV